MLSASIAAWVTAIVGSGSENDVEVSDSCARRKSSGGRKEQSVSICCGDADSMKGIVKFVERSSGSVVYGLSTPTC